MQDAEKDFLREPPDFRITLEIFYMPPQPDSADASSVQVSNVASAPTQESIIKLIQNDKEIAPRSVDRSPLYPADEWYVGGSLGEHVEIDCKPEKIDGSMLTIEIETPDGQRAETEFDLAKLK